MGTVGYHRVRLNRRRSFAPTETAVPQVTLAHAAFADAVGAEHLKPSGGGPDTLDVSLAGLAPEIVDPFLEALQADFRLRLLAHRRSSLPIT